MRRRPANRRPNGDDVMRAHLRVCPGIKALVPFDAGTPFARQSISVNIAHLQILVGREIHYATKL